MLPSIHSSRSGSSHVSVPSQENLESRPTNSLNETDFKHRFYIIYRIIGHGYDIMVNEIPVAIHVTGKDVFYT